jgi:hypothetical protein
MGHGGGAVNAAGAPLVEADLADALVFVQQCWRDEGLDGCPLEAGLKACTPNDVYQLTFCRLFLQPLEVSLNH